MNTTFLDACYKKKTSHIPVWYMRQAGRYLPAYKKVKGKINILDIVKTPELAAQIALQPIDILGVDAAILYADIMIPLLGIGVDLEIVENIGPIIAHPIQTSNEVKKLRMLEPEEDLTYLSKTIKMLRNELTNTVPLIGFSAAPFTLASYLIEGKPSRDFLKTKTFMYTQTPAWNLLMEKLSDIIIIYLKFQVKSGVQALQLFDSWVGCLSEQDYKMFVYPHTKRIFEEISKTAVPSIHFGTNTAGMLQTFSSVSCNVVSVDWRVPLAQAWKTVGYKKAIQGNLDPALLLGDFSLVKKRVDEMFETLPKSEGYIFNLGHGVLPATPVDNLKRLTEYVHSKK